MMGSLIVTLGRVINIYMLLCVVCVFMSWMPQLAMSTFGQILSSLCRPYLDWFKRFHFTRIGVIDFSPIIALGVLSIFSQACARLAQTGRLSPTILLIMVILLLWNFFSFILNFILILFIIRLVYDFINSSSSSPIWVMLDSFLNPIIFKVKHLFGNKPMKYRTTLILTTVVIFVIRLCLGYGVGLLLSWLKQNPSIL